MKRGVFLLFAGLVLNVFTVEGVDNAHSKGILDGTRTPPKRVVYSEEKKEAAKKIKHLIIIFQENWSFDSLYGTIPGADGIANAKPENSLQVNLMGNAYPLLPPSINTITKKPYSQIPDGMPNRPYDLQPFIDMNTMTGDLVHDFYLEQYQINGGMMNQFATYSDAGGFVMSYYDISKHRMGELAKEFVLCDNWFHSCYGGSMCGVVWLFAAQMMEWPTAPHHLQAKLLPSGVLLRDGIVSPDGYVINDAQPYYPPHMKSVPDKQRVPPQTFITIGDLLTEKGVTWKWYAEGWNDAILGNPDPTFVFHHQAPVYFKQYAPNTIARDDHLTDLNQFYIDLKEGTAPAVSFIRALDRYSQHPGDGILLDGLDWCAKLIKLIQESSVWKDCAIIVTYDENGGRWDHVSPPVVDRFGPGTRVPALIISPFAKKGFIDHTAYETVSILKFIEERWGLKPLSSRDASANNILNAFE